jgi:hypothetical protein
VVWTVALKQLDEHRTCLISRGHIATDWLAPAPKAYGGAPKKQIFIERIYSLLARLPWFLMALIAMTGHYIMESRMLYGIKRRAEASVRELKTTHPPEPVT